MQTLQPVLRVCQGSSLRRAAALSQYFPRPHPTNRIQGSQYRAQHDKYGPHKEYFQQSGQEPRPDLTSYVRETQQYAQTPPRASSQLGSTPPGQTHNPSESGKQQKAQGFSRILRLARGPIWFILFLQLGFLTGAAVITWEYLSPAFEPGSPEEQDLIEEILDVLDEHALVMDLRNSEWIEVDTFAPDVQHGLKGRHMVHQTLGGNTPQGVFMRVFHHPVQEYTMLVCFLGFGVEGWPDVIHGGLTSTLLEEGFSKHLSYYYPDHLTTPDNKVSIDFKKPCKPGVIYSVLVAPSGRKAGTAGNVRLTELQMTGMMMQVDGAPALGTQFDVATNTVTQTIGIPTRRGRQHEPTHAICRADVKLIPKEIKIDETAFQVGRIDEGFSKALDFLKKQPEFKISQPVPTEEEKEDDN